MAEVRIYPNSRVKQESAYLQNYGANVTSQCGEDGIIKRIFEIMGTSNKWCVEFGAWDGKVYSNTWNLLNHNKWKGVLIEAKREKYNILKENYADNPDVITINKMVDIVDGENSLDSILSHTPVPNDFDFLSIDIDGCDWHIWKSLAGYRPRLVVIEFNPSIPNHVSFVQDRDLKINHGSSLRAMDDLAKIKGYELVATTQWNAFFVREEDFEVFHIKDNSVDSMHTLGQLESIFYQLFDGTVVLSGCSRLLWHDIEINLDDIQVLPRALRRYRG